MNQPRLQGRRHGIRRWSAAPVLALLAGAAIGHAGVIAEKATFAARVPALVIRVLLTFAPTHPETSSRVERARAWLLSSFEIGVPHGLHQFSSFAGTAWATMALMYAAEPHTP